MRLYNGAWNTVNGGCYHNLWGYRNGYLKYSSGWLYSVIWQALINGLLCARPVIKHLFQLVQKHFRLDFSSPANNKS